MSVGGVGVEVKFVFVFRISVDLFNRKYSSSSSGIWELLSAASIDVIRGAVVDGALGSFFFFPLFLRGTSMQRCASPLLMQRSHGRCELHAAWNRLHCVHAALT